MIGGFFKLSLEGCFGAGDAFDAGIAFDGDTECTCEAFENRLGDVVAVASVKDFDVEIAAEIVGDGAAKFLDERKWHVGRVGGIEWRAKLEVRAVGEVDDDACERFVHGKVAVAVAGDAFFGAECFFDGLADGDACVFDGVVGIDFDVAFGGELEIDQGMFRKQGEHVVEERHACLDGAGAVAVEIERQFDGGFCGDALFGSGSRGRHKRG